jgi:phosphatidylserine/phosphatidylglycerophosphate/cardiolipin synthase-like enzyme
MSTRFFTNADENTLLKKFAGVFENNPDIEWFDALVGYLRSSGYFALRPYLDKVPHIRILVGIDVDAILADYHRRGLLFMPDSTKALEEFKNELRKDMQGSAYSKQTENGTIRFPPAPYTKETENGILQFIDDVISKKIELRAHPTKRLHAKLYIFRPKGFNEHKAGAVITGSSNLTAAGIGVEEQVSNYEFNALLHDFDDVQFATAEFKHLWEESVEILPKLLTEVRLIRFLSLSGHGLCGMLLPLNAAMVVMAVWTSGRVNPTPPSWERRFKTCDRIALRPGTRLASRNSLPIANISLCSARTASQSI